MSGVGLDARLHPYFLARISAFFTPPCLWNVRRGGFNIRPLFLANILFGAFGITGHPPLRHIHKYRIFLKHVDI